MEKFGKRKIFAKMSLCVSVLYMILHNILCSFAFSLFTKRVWWQYYYKLPVVCRFFPGICLLKTKQFELARMPVIRNNKVTLVTCHFVLFGPSFGHRRPVLSHRMCVPLNASYINDIIFSFTCNHKYLQTKCVCVCILSRVVCCQLLCWFRAWLKNTVLNIMIANAIPL